MLFEVRVSGSWFEVSHLGFGVFEVRGFRGSGFRGSGSGFGVSQFGFLRFRVWGFMVQGSGFRCFEVPG